MNQQNLYEYITETSEYLTERGVARVDVGIILGSGLARVREVVDVISEIDYEDIPHLPSPRVLGHGKKLVYGRIGDRNVMVFSGRVHYYEGYPMWQVAYPVRIIARMGASTLVTTGAVGGLNEQFSEGSIVAIRDHISLMPDNPLRGPHDDRLGERFPDMSEPYDNTLRTRAVKAAEDLGIRLFQGVYVGLPGPNLETRAEYEFLHRIGADCVAMSMIPEVIVAAQERLSVLGLAVMGNMCYPPENVRVTTSEDVVAAVGRSARNVGQLISTLM